MASIHALVQIFDEIRALLARHDNNFAYSGWEDSAEALTEVDQVRSSLRAESFVVSPQMALLFLPTGPLQEVSIGSGWGEELLELANRFDHAVQAEECACFQSTQQKGVPFELMGLTEDYAEVTLGKCPQCGQHWLRYLYENEGFTGSGRWFLGAISAEQANDLRVEESKSLLEGLEWYWYGGSYFGGNTGIRSGQIRH